MSKLLIVIDMQNDFVSGALGSDEAQGIVEKVHKKIVDYKRDGHNVLFTRDTHTEHYLNTAEGRVLPVEHCMVGTRGWHIVDEFCTFVEDDNTVDKYTFGTFDLIDAIRKYRDVEEVELCGVCTDICVVTNALILKTAFPEVMVTVDQSCCAGTSPGGHDSAIATMKACQVNIIGDRDD